MTKNECSLLFFVNESFRQGRFSFQKPFLSHYYMEISQQQQPPHHHQQQQSHIWEEWTQMRRKRRFLQSRLEQQQQPDITHQRGDAEHEHIPGPRGRLLQLALVVLLDPVLLLPIDADTILLRMQLLDPQTNSLFHAADISGVDELLYWLEQQYESSMKTSRDVFGGRFRPFLVTAADQGRLAVLYLRFFQEWPSLLSKPEPLQDQEIDAETLLSIKSAKEQQQQEFQQQAIHVLTTPSVDDLKPASEVQSKDGAAVRFFCPNLLREKCPEGKACQKIHFVILMKPHTDIASGDCPYVVGLCVCVFFLRNS